MKEEELPAYIDAMLALGVIAYTYAAPKKIVDSTFDLIVSRLKEQGFSEQLCEGVAGNIDKAVKNLLSKEVMEEL